MRSGASFLISAFSVTILFLNSVKGDETRRGSAVQERQGTSTPEGADSNSGQSPDAGLASEEICAGKVDEFRGKKELSVAFKGVNPFGPWRTVHHPTRAEMKAELEKRGCGEQLKFLSMVNISIPVTIENDANGNVNVYSLKPNVTINTNKVASQFASGGFDMSMLSSMGGNNKKCGMDGAQAKKTKWAGPIPVLFCAQKDAQSGIYKPVLNMGPGMKIPIKKGSDRKGQVVYSVNLPNPRDPKNPKTFYLKK